MVSQLFNEIEILKAEIRRLKGKVDRNFSGGTLVTPAAPAVISNATISVIARFTNNSGGALVDGDVVALDVTGFDLCTTTTTADDLSVLGVVRGDDGPYANGILTPVLIHGNILQLAVTGTVVIGDYLNASATPGTAYSVGAVPTPGSFARAESSDVAGFCGAFVFPVIAGSGGGDDVFIVNMAVAL